MISSVTALLVVLGEGSARTSNLITGISVRQTTVFAAAFMAAALAAPAADPDGGGEGEVRRFEIQLREGRTSSGDLQVSKGERVELIWIADTPTALHLHGYDIELTLAPGARATMAFTAFATGRFPVTVHRTGPGEHHETLLYLEVHPR